MVEVRAWTVPMSLICSIILAGRFGCRQELQRCDSHHPGECGWIPVDKECFGEEQRGFKDVLAVHWPDDNAPHITVHLHSGRA